MQNDSNIFKVRRQAIKKQLRFLKKNPFCNDIEINKNKFFLIPVNVNVSSQINVLDIEEEIEDQIDDKDKGLE